MIDAKISFSPAEMAASTRDRRLAPLAGLGIAALASAGLWALLVFLVSRML